MSKQVLFVGTYAIPEGKFEEWNRANKNMTEFAKVSGPRVLRFNTYVNEDRTEATTVQLHPDSESLEYHLEAARTRISGGVQLVAVKRIELHGEPSEAVVAQLRSLSERSGAWPVVVKRPLHGFSRADGARA